MAVKACMSSRNIFEFVNRRIFDFVRETPNRRLMPGTGTYSTPFRGSLFGQTESSAVAQQLAIRGVDILWLGSNPGVADSLRRILTPNGDAGDDFPQFERQMASGYFSERHWDEEGNSIPDWNPIERPRGGWTIYRDLFVDLGAVPDAIAMANFIPWGSQDMKALITQIRAVDPGLLQRMMAFAEALNAEIVQTIKPKLLVVPFSLGRSSQLDATYPLDISVVRATQVHAHQVELDRGTFNFYTGVCQRGALQVPTVWLRHPVSLRLTHEGKDMLRDEFPKALGFDLSRGSFARGL